MNFYVKQAVPVS